MFFSTLDIELTYAQTVYTLSFHVLHIYIFFRENYIKMDIFYKELSYMKIRQQRAFEFISLLSEVGGFLGLLLGASVLTVCELVDYLALSSMNKMKERSRVIQAKTSNDSPNPMKTKKSVLETVMKPSY